ncbi:MAG: hypothetical protein L0G49_13785 [Luteococcus sp.]|uniref:hypothetical protein n=1 Tax=Luteococcus sp. TaxID=1969402 RepID=UPI002648028C|nr:hypothetical protein [Luteococcus sp.]MDN5564811.1 hypothetical protein [Luteococcus sp.]
MTVPSRVQFHLPVRRGVGEGEVTPVLDSDRSKRESKVQARDEESGELLWQVDFMDFDPEARERTLKVKVAAPVQLVPPDALSNALLGPGCLWGCALGLTEREA